MEETNQTKIQKKKRILIVEDQGNHIEDARKYFEKVTNYSFDYADNYADAQHLIVDHSKELRYRQDLRPGQWLIKPPRKDLAGVILDTHFPVNCMETHEAYSRSPLGLKLAFALYGDNVPFVLNAGARNESEYELIFDLAKIHQWDIVRNESTRILGSGASLIHSAENKNWEKAWRMLRRKIGDKIE